MSRNLGPGPKLKRLPEKNGKHPTFEEIDKIFRVKEKSMTEFEELLRVLVKLGVPFKFYIDPEFLHGHSTHKQDIAISLNESVDLNFKDGKFVGSNTQGAGSWKKREVN